MNERLIAGEHEGDGGPQDAARAAAVGSVAVSPADCLADGCAALRQDSREMDEDVEAMLLNVLDAAERWNETIDSAKGSVSAFMAMVDAELSSTVDDSQASRKIRRNVTTICHERTADRLAVARQQDRKNVLTTISSVCGGTDIDVFLMSADVVALRTLAEWTQSTYEKTSQVNWSVDEASATAWVSPYSTLFLREIQARIELALAARLQPEALRDMLAPENLAYLSSGVQRFVAADIEHGAKTSLVLQLFRDAPEYTDAAGEEPDYAAFTGPYLEHNGYSSAADIAIRSMVSMACAMGAPLCPANGPGLCENAVAIIPPQKLPVELKADMQNRLTRQHQATLDALAAFARNPGVLVSRWWRVAEAVQPGNTANGAPAQSGRKSGKRRPVVQSNTRSVNESLEADDATERGLPREILVAYNGGHDVLTIASDDETERYGAVNAVMQSEAFQKYLRRFTNDSLLPSALRDAVGRILFTPIYRTDPSIKRLVPSLWLRDDIGHKYDAWRLRLGHMTGTSGYKNTNQTRIQFGHLGTSARREVYIHSVRHKTDIEQSKRNMRSGL